ncbi:hypothetical protein LMH87_001927 [Akanthomyces muscarius]|uniref:CHAT domain-containing protein n=1 Tax=Akanthomyces muscarius TaxID=2231603 RepID=A0A9W8Q8L1_AKAMU|nr:hypothetical protein LMH87_001927 [Akanthomyces muscarius]KAJ4147406.1 hypothetical protein LMH87_001927 [Akanthomyces muscarius]
MHFHGHVQFEESDMLHHRLELRILPAAAQPPPPPPPPHDDGGGSGAPTSNVDDDGWLFSAADTLEADDIFDVRLPRPTQVTHTGCRSGQSVNKDADDHLGLTTALHYAGASSVLFTLWKIDTEDGLKFSKAFYREFRREAGDGVKRRAATRRGGL